MLQNLLRIIIVLAFMAGPVYAQSGGVQPVIPAAGANMAQETGGNLATVGTNTGATSTALGATSDAAASAGGTGSVNAKLRTVTDLLNQILTELGQKLETLPTSASTSAVAIRCVNTAGNAFEACGGSGGGGGGTSSNFGSAFPSVGTAIGGTDGTNMVAPKVTTSTPGASDAGFVVRNISSTTATAGSAVPSNGAYIMGTDGTNARGLKLDTSGEAQVDVLSLPALPAGNNNIGDVDVASLPALPAGNNNIGDVDVASLPALPAGSNTIGNVGILPTTSGGTSTCYITSAASTNATNCKASAGQVYGYDLVNTTTTIYYLRLYNLSSAPTCSSATGFIRSIPIPPAGAAGQAGGLARSLAVGQAYGTGIGFCLTGGGSSTDNTSSGTGVYVAIDYK